MTEPTIKTQFTLESLITDKRNTNSHQYTSIDQIMIMDLDAYNYISAFLFEGMGTDEGELQALDLPERQQVFKEEFLSNPRLFLTVQRPEVLPNPIVKRLSIGIALVAIEQLTDLRNKTIEDEESPAGIIENYNKNREMVECYNRLVQFLFSESLQMHEKAEPIISEMIVEFKSLAFLSELAGGYYDSSSKEIKKFDADQAVVLLDTKLALSADEIAAMGEHASHLLGAVLDVRRSELIRSISAGEVALDSSVSLNTEQILLKCLMTIGISANTEMLPVLLPVYRNEQSTQLENLCKTTSTALRKQKGGSSKPDWMSISNVAKKQKVSTPVQRRSPSAEHTGPKPSRKRKVWSDEETEALRLGMEQYGNDWVAIHRNFSHVLIDRHPVSLKDRARSMRRILERNGQPLGVWASASKP